MGDADVFPISSAQHRSAAETGLLSQSSAEESARQKYCGGNRAEGLKSA